MTTSNKMEGELSATLRRYATHFGGYLETRNISIPKKHLYAAADLITRLTAERNRLREALEIAKDALAACSNPDIGMVGENPVLIAQKALAALTGVSATRSTQSEKDTLWSKGPDVD